MVPTVYTSLGVSAVAARPSPRCMHWTEDGQLIIVTKGSVYIMTPEHGINFDLESLLRSTSFARKPTDADVHIGWFRTMVQLDKATLIKWPEYSQEWGAGSLGSIDTSISAIATSPTNVTPHAGCVLAVLSSNMDLSLWTAGKNGLKGEWNKVFDVVQFLMKQLVPKGSPSLAQVLQLQIICITWTAQTDFRISPRPINNASLLVCGSRGGSLIFVRYTEEHEIEHVKTTALADGWITHVASSRWRFTSVATSKARVAYAVANGGVAMIEVTAKLEPRQGFAPFSLEMKLSYDFGEKILSIVNGKQAVTTLQWIQVKGDVDILVYAQPGFIGLWTDDTDRCGWCGIRTFRIQYQRVSAGSSTFLPVSGIHYAEAYDALIVTLFDGSVHVVHQLTTDPSWTRSNDTKENNISTDSLSSLVRAIFVRCESRVQSVADIDDNRMSGFIPYDDMGSMVWIQEVSRTADFSYKHDAKLSSMLIVAQVWEQSLQDSLEKLENILKTSDAYTSPLSILRPAFFNFRTKSQIALSHEALVKILSLDISDQSKEIIIHAYTDELTPEIRRAFRRSLVQHLFGWDSLLRLRTRLSFTDYLWKMSDPARQTEIGFVAQSFLNAISHRVLRTVIRHISAAMQCLTASDAPFALRMVVQSLLPGSPPDLSSEGQLISEQIHTLLADDQSTNSLVEHCPACKEEIPLQNITAAVCSKGHTWSRCSITTFILSTPYVRTCIGCTRKAFLPPSSSGAPKDREWLPAAGRGWVVEELLEAVHRCLFCSNTFVSVV